jgi:hypothetical protein
MKECIHNETAGGNLYASGSFKPYLHRKHQSYLSVGWEEQPSKSSYTPHRLPHASSLIRR